MGSFKLTSNVGKNHVLMHVTYQLVSTCPWMPICIATIGSKMTPRIGQPIRYAAIHITGKKRYHNQQSSKLSIKKTNEAPIVRGC